VSSTPPGARISVGSSDTGMTTPAKVGVAKGSHPVSITLRLKGYETYTFKSVDASEASTQNADLKPKTTTTTTAVKCKALERTGCVRDARGCCVPESSESSGHNGTGNKTGSARRDPDDLMRPDSP